MKKWQTTAIKAINKAAKDAKEQVLNHPDNDYESVRGEVSFDLITKPYRSHDYTCTLKSRIYSTINGKIK